MPVIPTYNRQVAEQDMPSVRQQMDATPDMYGAGIARAVGQAGAVATEIGAKEKEREDTEAVVNASNSLMDSYYRAAYGDNGFITRKGDKAIGIGAEAEAFFKQEYDKHVSTLKNRDQVLRFTAHNRENMFNFKRNILTHERQEKEQYQAAKFKAGLDTSVALITSNMNNPEMVASVRAAKIREIQNYAEAMGAPKEVIAKEIQTYNTQLLIASFEQAKDNGDLGGMNRALQMFGKDANPIKVADFKRQRNEKSDKYTLEARANEILAAARIRPGEYDEAKIQQLIGSATTGMSRQTMTVPPDAAKYFEGNISGVSSGLIGAMAMLAKDLGKKIVINSAKRTTEEQAALYAAYKNGTGNLAAKPGTSPHEFGDAIDTNSFDDVSDAKLAEYGIERTVAGERWHYEFVGGFGTPSADRTSSKLKTLVRAAIADEKRIQTQEKQKQFDSFITQYDGAKTLTEAVKMIDSFFGDGYANAEKKKKFMQNAKARFSTGLTEGQQHFLDYEKGKLKTDRELYFEWKRLMTEPGSKENDAKLKDKHQEFMDATARINQYHQIAEGKLDPDTLQPIENNNSPERLQARIRELVAQGKSDAEIEAILTGKK